MISLYTFFDSKKYVLGGRKDSMLYLFINKERAASLMESHRSNCI